MTTFRIFFQSKLIITQVFALKQLNANINLNSEQVGGVFGN
jgi:hypothetical protein